MIQVSENKDAICVGSGLCNDHRATLFTAAEGNFTATVWQYHLTRVYGLSCAGQANDAGWDDESDPSSAIRKALRFLENVQPSLVVYDLFALQLISPTALAHLEDCHSRLASRGCETTLVRSPKPIAPVALNRQLALCHQEGSVPEAVLFLHLNHRSRRVIAGGGNNEDRS